MDTSYNTEICRKSIFLIRYKRVPPKFFGKLMVLKITRENHLDSLFENVGQKVNLSTPKTEFYFFTDLPYKQKYACPTQNVTFMFHFNGL